MSSPTPIGDWLHKRYPPNSGATHYFGVADDPGCCAGPHPLCTYSAGYREGQRRIIQLAITEAERLRALPFSPTRNLPAAGTLDAFVAIIEADNEPHSSR